MLLTVSDSSSRSHAPWPPLLRVLLALTLTSLLIVFLSAPILAQQRTPAKKKTQTSSARSSGGGSSGGGAGYTTALGLRAGSPSGLTIKHFFRGPVAVEGILGTNLNRHGFNLTVLLEKHAQAFGARGLLWYYGLGGHVSSYTGRSYYEWYYVKHKGRRYYIYDDYYEGRFWGLGIDGALGLEYQFQDLPFTLGVDAKPIAELTRGNAFFWVEGALSLRYVF